MLLTHGGDQVAIAVYHTACTSQAVLEEECGPVQASRRSMIGLVVYFSQGHSRSASDKLPRRRRSSCEDSITFYDNTANAYHPR